MYDDFRRAKQNLKKALDISVSRFSRHQDLSRRHSPSLSSISSCLQRDANTDLDIDFHIGLDTYKLVTKDARRCGNRYACLDQLSTPTKLQNLQVIKNLVKLLKNKISARLQVEKIVTENTASLGTCRLPGGFKSGNIGVNDLPFLPTKNVPHGFSSDFSSILEDVNALESFLKVVAPLFMNYILSQKETTETKIRTVTNPKLCDQRRENENPTAIANKKEDITKNSSEDKLLQNHCEGKLSNIEDDMEMRLFLNNESHEECFTPGVITVDIKTIDQSRVSHDCKNLKDSRVSKTILKEDENGFFTSHNLNTSEVNRCNLDFFSQDQDIFQKHIPCYPSFEQQFGDDFFPLDLPPWLQGKESPKHICSLQTAAKKTLLDAKTLPSKPRMLPTDNSFPCVNIQNKDMPDPSLFKCTSNLKIYEQDLLLKLSPSAEKQSEIATDISQVIKSTRQTNSRNRSSCRYFLNGVGHGSPQSMIPLDFNLNALHIKPAFTEDHKTPNGNNANTDVKVCTSSGAEDAPAVAHESTEAYRRRCIENSFNQQEPARKTSEHGFFDEDRAEFYDSTRNMRDGLSKFRPNDSCLPVNRLRQTDDSLLTAQYLCPAAAVMLMVGTISGTCWMSSTPWEIWLLVTILGICLLLGLSIFESHYRGCFATGLQESWTDISTSLTRSQDKEEPQWLGTQPKQYLAYLPQSDDAQVAKQRNTPTISSQLDTTKRCDNALIKSASLTPNTECDVYSSRNVIVPTEDDMKRRDLIWSNEKVLAENIGVGNTITDDPQYIVGNCGAWGVSPVLIQQIDFLSTKHSQASTDSASTMTEHLLEWMPDMSQLHEPDTCMASTMTESPTMTSSSAQTDDSTCSLDDDSDGENDGQVQVVELSGQFPPPVTSTVGVQADMGARRLSQKTEKVRKEHQMSLKRLRRKFLSIRRKCQMEALALKQCDQKKKNFLCQLQLSLPGLQQEKRSLLAERAAIERQFEDEKKKNRDLVGRLTRLNHQFSKLGQSQQQLLLPPTQTWRHQQHQISHPYNGANIHESNNNTTPCNMHTSTSNHSSQEDNLLPQHRFNHTQLHNQMTSVSSSCRGNTVPGHCLSVFSQSKMAKLLTTAGGAIGTALPLQQSKVAKQQSTLLQTGQVRPNNAVPTQSGHVTAYQDHKHQPQQQQQHTRQQQQQQQILMKQQQILQQQQRLPIFQLFNRPATNGQAMQDGSSAQQQQPQQQQQK